MPPLPPIQSRIRALILDRHHRCLLLWQERGNEGSWMIPGIDIPVGAPSVQRPLAMLQTAIRARLGLKLPSPSGSYAPTDCSSRRDFAFILQDPSVITGAHFMPLQKAQAALHTHAERDHLWRLYTETVLGGYELPTQDFDVFHFGHDPVQAAKLAHLVLKGSKRTTSGLIAAAEKQGATIPHEGLVSVVTDYYGYPLCVIETVEVRKVKFRDVTLDIATGEGEGDLSYADWREGHIDYFSREAAEYGLEFNDDSLIFNEVFRVIKILGRAESDDEEHDYSFLKSMHGFSENHFRGGI